MEHASLPPSGVTGVEANIRRKGKNLIVTEKAIKSRRRIAAKRELSIRSRGELASKKDVIYICETRRGI